MSIPTLAPTDLIRCEACEKLFPPGQIEYAPDPFEEEIHHDETPVWECYGCRREIAREI